MRLQFPEGFLLGVSSASAQIEGGEVGSNWNDWYHQGRIKDDSDPAVADDHWNRWREDCALMAGLHLPIARMGVEWARIMPARGEVDEAAIAHYRAELEYMRQLGIRPLLTIHHFSNPIRASGRLFKAGESGRFSVLRKALRRPLRRSGQRLDHHQRAERLRHKRLFLRRLASRP